MSHLLQARANATVVNDRTDLGHHARDQLGVGLLLENDMFASLALQRLLQPCDLFRLEAVGAGDAGPVAERLPKVLPGLRW